MGSGEGSGEGGRWIGEGGTVRNVRVDWAMGQLGRGILDA